jgi:hypothetical protein
MSVFGGGDCRDASTVARASAGTFYATPLKTPLEIKARTLNASELRS